MMTTLRPPLRAAATAAAFLFAALPLLLRGQAPNVSSSKTDTFTPNGAGKAMPGAPINYSITINNAAGAGAATGVTLTDPTPVNTTLVPGSVNVSPLAVNDAFNAVANTQLVVGNATALSGPKAVVGGGVLANDTEFLSDTFAISAFDATSANGGAVAMVTSGLEAGAFTYVPPVGFTGTDTFTYTIRDDGTDSIANNGDDLTGVGTVTITVGAQKVWYVDSSAGLVGDGRSTAPFDSLADVTGATGPDATGDIIYVRTGGSPGTPYTGGITLLNNQTLWGENETLIVGSFTLQAAGTDPLITNSGGNGVTLASGNTLKGFTVGDTQSGSFDITNTAAATVGTLTVSNVIVQGTGGSFRADSGGALTVTLDSATTTSTSGHGIHLAGATSGTFTVTAGALSASGTEVLVNGGTAVVSIGASITSSNGGSVDISNHSTGNVTFSGPLNITAGTGIACSSNTSGTIAFTNASKVINTGANPAVSLSSNTGATINFTGGGLDIDTTSGAGFSATGGGTVTVQGSNNTINSVSATALNVANTTIGASGLTFLSLTSGNATAAADPANGIVLNNTGSSGGLTVTGDSGGTNNGSGGTIQNCTGSGVMLTSTSNTSLNYMNITACADDGISGLSVSGFSMNRGNVTNNGNAVNTDDNIDFGGSGLADTNTGLTGTASITNSSLTGGYNNQLGVRNNSGTVALTITGCTITGRAAENNNNDGILLQAQSTATITSRVQNCSFSANKGDHFQAAASNSGNINATFKTNTLTGGHSTALGQGITINAATGAPGWNGTVNYDIDDNTINGAVGPAIAVVQGTSASTAVFNGFIRNNRIGTTGVALSGSVQTHGIISEARGNGAHTCAITGNTIRRAADRGIGIAAGDGSAIFNLTITGNTVTELLDTNATNGTPREAIEFNLGISSTNVFGVVDAPIVRVNLSNPQLVGGAFKNGDIRMRKRMRARVELPSYAGTATDTAAVITYLQGNNAGTVATCSFTDDPGAAVTTDGYFATIGAVPTPTATPLPLLFAENLPEPAEGSGLRAALLPLAAGSPAAAVHAEKAAQTALKPVLAETALTNENLQNLVTEAQTRWEATGLTEAQKATLKALRFEISDLDTLHLGRASGDLIQVSRTAAGNSWFIDPTPADDSEFGIDPPSSSVIRHSAADGVDLLTTLMHEMGHALGLPDRYDLRSRRSIMFSHLTRGERRLPRAGEAAGAVPHEQATPHFLSAPITIGTLPPGKTVTVVYQTIINDPPVAANISNQGTVSGSNFANVLTDDPAVGGAADPTLTPVELPDVNLAVAPAAVAEDGAGTLTYTFTREGGTTSALTVNFARSGTASSLNDYTVGSGTGTVTFDGTAGTGTIVIPVGSATGTLILSPTDDITVEPDETAILTVTTGAGYDVGTTPAATGTLANDDTDVSVTLDAPATVSEDGATNLVFTFTRAGVTTNSLTANFTVGGAATFGTDYTQSGAATFTTTSGTVTFGAGVTQVQVTLDPTADNSVEGNETAIVNIAAGAGYNAVGGAPPTGTINNDDSTITIAVAPASVLEDGASNLVYTFTRTGGPTTNALTVNFGVSGTATLANSDYAQSGAATYSDTAGTVTFAAASSTATITVNPTTDATNEPDETVILTLAANGTPAATGGYTVGSAPNDAATGTITDDDLPQVSVSTTVAAGDNDAAEGGANNGVYTFTRNQTTGALTANFQLHASSTATAGTDFTLSGAASFDNGTGAGTVSFANGVGTVVVTLTALTESPNAAEAAETARLDVVPSAGVYVAGASPNATVTIAANSFVVTTTTDGGTGSLRQAVLNANNIAGADTITFTVNGTFTLTGAANEDNGNAGDLDVKQSLAIQGNGVANTIIDGGGIERIFDVFPSAASTFALSNLTLQNGDTRTLSFKEGGAMYLHNNVTTTITACRIINNFSGANGAIENRGSMTMADSEISGNQTIPASGTVVGGGIHNAGTMTILRSTIANNSVRGEGGGIATTTVAATTVNIINTTISGNTASVTGGGLGNGGGVSTTGNQGTINIVNSTISGNFADNNGGGAAFVTPGGGTGNVTLINSTITNNTADNDNNGSGAGGGFSQSVAAVTLRNTVVAGNFNSINTVRDDVSGAIVGSSSFNLLGDGTGSTGLTNGVNNNQVGSGASPINALLGALQNNGGPTLTHALLAGSPALNTGSNAQLPVDTFDADGDTNTAEVLDVDQRGTGFTRAIGTVDIGAFELQKSVSIGNLAAISEGNSGTTNFVFTITRTGDTTGNVTMNYAVSGAAVNGTDFVGGNLPTGTATITNGNSTTTVTIPVSGDTSAELDEAFTVTLSAPDNGYVVSGAPATSTITNDDTLTVTINQAAGQADPANASPINFTVVFSEPVTGFGDVAGDVTLSGTAGATTNVVTGGPTTYNVAVSGMSAQGTVIASIPAAAALSAGSAQNQASTSTDNTVTRDTVAPTVGIVVTDTALRISETSLVTITFSEAVTGFTNTDLSIANGTLSAVSSSDGGTTWTATLTPNANIEDATNVITLNKAGVADLAGNAGVGTTDSNNYAIDTQRPTVTIVVADTSLIAGETSLVTITFSEAVTGFTNADLTVANGTLSAVSTGDGGVTWTATLTPTAGITDSTNVITLALTGVADGAGNAGTGTSNSNNYAIDTQRPTATIVVADTNLTIGETSLVTITFSEAVTGFTNADLTVQNGTLSAVSSSDSGVTWTATLTPLLVVDGTNVITLANTGVQDAAGNTGTGTTDSNNYAIDIQSVTITATDASADENTAGTGTWRVSRNGTSGALTVNLAIDASSSAVAADWTQSGASFSSRAPGSTGTVVIPNGQTFVDVTLTPSADIQAEADETVRLNVTADAAYVIGSPDNATVTIAQNDFVVINTNDAGEGSLRQAVLNANALAGTDTITFGGTVFTDATVPDVITLTSGQLSLTTGMNINGPGADALSISGNNASQVFNNTGTATLRDLTITGGSTGTFGGGIFNSGTLNLARVHVTGNHAGTLGGGLRNLGGGVVTIVNCAFTNNTCGGSAGAAIDSDGTVTLINSTISGNTASGLVGVGGIYSTGTLTIINSTITGNRGSSASGRGGIFASGTETLRNTVVAGNFSGTGSAPLDIVGTINTATNNLIGDSGSSGGITHDADGNPATGSNNIVGNAGAGTLDINTVLNTTLANNGGPTLTHALIAGSPALNNGNNADLPADTFDVDGDSNVAETLDVDQRGAGFVRIIGTTVDIGAVEAPKSATTTTLASSVNPSLFSQGVTFTATVTSSVPGAGTPTGTVTFTIDGNAQPPVALDAGGQATFTTSALAVGSHTITADYGGSDLFLTSSSTTVNQTVNKANTSTVVTSSNPASLIGTPVTLTATVTAVAPAAGTPTGTVQFFLGNAAMGGPIALAGGQVQLTTSTLPQGNNSITAVYSGDGGFNGSTSAAFIQRVGTATPTPTMPATPPGGFAFSMQTGLFAITVPVQNTTAFALNGFRLHVNFGAFLAAHPSLRLYNATNAPGANPAFVDYNYPVALDQTVPVTLVFYTNNLQFPNPFTPVLTVEALSQPPGAGPAPPGGVPITDIRVLADGTKLLEWATVAGRWYRIHYSADMVSWFICPVPIQAGSNRQQWIDSGAPFTDISSADPSVVTRFYIVTEIPLGPPP